MEPLYLKHDHQESGNQSALCIAYFISYLFCSHIFLLVKRWKLSVIIAKNTKTNKRLKCISMRRKEDDHDPH